MKTEQEKLKALRDKQDRGATMRELRENPDVKEFFESLEQAALSTLIHADLHEDDKRRAAACEIQTLKKLQSLMMVVDRYGIKAEEAHAKIMEQESK